MRLQFSLNHTITPQLSTQLIQHLNILQLSNIELGELIQEKSLENPLIDAVISTMEKPYDWLKFATAKGSRYGSNYEPLFIKQESVYDLLLEQIPLFASEQEKAILRYLVYALDERLFLTVTAKEVSTVFSITEAHAKQMIQVLQTFEPVGVGAENVMQFFLMHIEADDDAPTVAKEFMLHETKAVAKMDFTALSKRYNMTVEEVLETIEYIKQLPRTPAITLHSSAPFIVPDVAVQKIDGQWFIELNEHATPKIKLHDLYVELLKNADNDYLQECMRDYVTLVQGIDFRKKTLYAIVDYIVTNQYLFLEKGIKGLQSMGLKDVAKALEIHESTVSRAIKGKYIQTPHGIMPIQQLFVKAISNSTPSAICELIQSLIAAEPTNEPYSDQQIVYLLKQEGIDISRRTVAKYREQLNIPSSKKRAYLFSSKLS
ncbi:RNA polymerase factor sigma-54 [Lysinibacillus sp. LZ02]|uniref:RNA polymerase factor sigma-54 n=1 Tax=Lysinibacillus sp. LZ02 TaxID=3420668 RepID=UPI003D36AA67